MTAASTDTPALRALADAETRGDVTPIGDGAYQVALAGRTVTGEVEVRPTVVAILEWTSRQEGKGNTTTALAQLRSLWPGRSIIAEASGCEQASPASLMYWQHQVNTGRADLHIDDYGDEHGPA